MIYDTWNILSMLYCFGQLFLANTCRGAFFLTPQKKSGVVECGVFVRAFSFRMTPFGCRCVNNAPFFPLAQCRSSLGILATRRSKKSAWLKWSSFADNPCTFVCFVLGVLAKQNYAIARNICTMPMYIGYVMMCIQNVYQKMF